MRTFVEEELEEKESADTEITLGMKSLLGVFFGSVLVCGVFFGFGYSLGRGNAKPTPEAAVAPSPAVGVAPSTQSDEPTPNAAPPQSAPSESASTQPAATGESDLRTVISDPDSSSASPAASKAPTSDGQYEYVATPQGPARRPAGAPPKSKPRAGVIASAPALMAPAVQQQTPQSAAAQPVIQQPTLIAAHPTAPAPAAPALSSAAKPASAGSVMVQIAAISRQEDANILVSALRRHGYSVVVRNDPKDSLLHVQLGPFSRDDAKAMRTRLLADGYNAILK
jgi:cell division septation protein DedD